jgi:histidyl-tRNA synthetase
MEESNLGDRKKNLTLRTPIGTRDFLPEDMIFREYVTNSIRKVFEEYGYDPMETPAIELGEVLKGKYGEEEKLIYEFKDRGGRDIALRYDLTVPLSRVMASNPHLPKPFKRYQISRVWRYENPQRGRYREFWQCDVDIVGSKSMLADAELVALATDVYKALGFNDFRIRINDRKILDAICIFAGVKENQRLEVLRTLDKVDKIGVKGFEENLKKSGFPDECIQKILGFIRVEGDPSEVLDSTLQKLGSSDLGAEGVGELKQLIGILKELGVESRRYVIDLSLSRGLDYYTGPIYEIVVTEPRIGSLSGGGRYDKLVRDLGGVDVPATGISFGLERIIDVMKELKMVTLPKTKTLVLVSAIDDSTVLQALRIASELRKAGIPVRTDVVGERRIAKQLKYADSLGIPYVVIVGQAEMEKGVLKFRFMEKREEKDMKLEEISEFLKGKLRASHVLGSGVPA